MRPILVAFLVSTLLVGAAAASVPLFRSAAEAADADADAAAARVPAGMRSGEMEMGASDHMAGAHDWHGGQGEVPTLLDAMTKLQRRSTITIGGDKAFTPAQGVHSGKGTFDDPFVISGWYVDTILIKDTTKAFEIRDNYVSSLLILDWTAQGGYVHHNHLENMRTNRNVARTGDPTAAVFENNEIRRVQELRHFDGEVRNNVIGDAQASGPLLVTEGVLPLTLGAVQNAVAFNIAGLNGAGIHDNTIYGGVDMKLHGHHHGDHSGGASHNHGKAEDAAAAARHEKHQVRFVDFEFYGNRIIDSTGFGLRYNDLAHAGDDRTATSEQEPSLELAHVHHTRVHIHDNQVQGASLRVQILNAPDERHETGEEATLLLENNTITKPNAGDGIIVQDVRDATILIQGNKVAHSSGQVTGGAAISMLRFKNATILVGPNEMGAYDVGVKASQFDAKTHWVVLPQKGDVKQAIYYDASVQNPPNEDDAGAEASHDDGHDHDHGHDAASAAPVPVALFDVPRPRQDRQGRGNFHDPLSASTAKAF